MQDFSEPLIYKVCAHTRVLASQATDCRTLWLVHLKAPEPHGAYLGTSWWWWWERHTTIPGVSAEVSAVLTPVRGKPGLPPHGQNMAPSPCHHVLYTPGQAEDRGPEPA